VNCECGEAHRTLSTKPYCQWVAVFPGNDTSDKWLISVLDHLQGVLSNIFASAREVICHAPGNSWSVSFSVS